MQRTISSLPFALPYKQGEMWTQEKTHLPRFWRLNPCAHVWEGEGEEEKGREKILSARVEGF